MELGRSTVTSTSKTKQTGSGWGRLTSRTAEIPRAQDELANLLAFVNHAVDAEDRGIPVDASLVIDVISKASKVLVKGSDAKGVLLVLDEAGKFLEYAATHDDRDNVHFLQMLAEAAARSGEIPVVVVCLLHQGVEAYAERLPQSAQREWAKAAGRFDEIVFANGLPAVADLVSGALGVNRALVPHSVAGELVAGMRWAIGAGWYGYDYAGKQLQDSAIALYPIHPTVLPIAAVLARRLAQNERSLLSLVLSDDPGSVWRWSRQEGTLSSEYRLSDLFDYLRFSGGIRVDGFSRRAYWPRLLAAVDSVPGDDRDATLLVKTVAVLNLVEPDGFFATQGALLAATAGQIPDPSGVLERLYKKAGLLHDRGVNAGFALWPHTSVDLAGLFAKAYEAVGRPDIFSLVSSVLPRRAVVAKRHYIETGTLRHFAVQYARVESLQSLLSQSEVGPGHLRPQETSGDTAPDGRLVIVLSATQREQAAAIALATGPNAARSPDTVIGVSEILGGLEDLARTVASWRYMLGETPDLGYDAFALEEARRSLADAEAALAERARWAAGLDIGGAASWYRSGQEVDKTRLRLSALASDACDEVFSAAPRVNNELLNRRVLSSAAAAARMRLIEALLEHAGSPMLNLASEATPPEKSMYLSVFHAGGLHRKAARRGTTRVASADVDEEWEVAIPDGDADPLNFSPLFAHMKGLLTVHDAARVPVPSIYAELQRPPYGVRTGVLPLVLAIYVAAHRGQVAFYERGTFLREVSGSMFMRLIKNPADFMIQWHPIDEQHAELYAKIAAAVRGVRGSVVGTKNTFAVVECVQQLTRFAATLPEFSQRTSSVALATTRVRESLFQARDPLELLIESLPVAVGIDGFRDRVPTRTQVDGFVGRLVEALADLRDAYPRLLDRVRDIIATSFGVSSQDHHRLTLALRAKALNQQVSELRLRGLCLRFADDKLDDTAWLESVASYLVEKPPSRWLDLDEAAFVTEVSHIAQRFVRAELAQPVAAAEELGTFTTHVYLTRSTGEEHSYRVSYGPSEAARVASLVGRLRGAVGALDMLALAAIAQVLTDDVGDVQERKEAGSPKLEIR
jgi:hypothetical protein